MTQSSKMFRMRIFAILPLRFAPGCATLFNDGTKTVAMSSNPSGAEVWIDGARRGTTPVSLDLNNHKSHTVVFRREGHQMSFLPEQDGAR